jgi:hypothetical protein
MFAFQDCCEDAIKSDSLHASREEMRASLTDYETQRLEQLDSTPRDDSLGEVPGSDRADREEALFASWLSEEDHSFYEGHKGLGNSQKAEVAWLEKRFAETGNDGYSYEEVDVRSFMKEPKPSLLAKLTQGSFARRRGSRDGPGHEGR